MEGSGLSTYAVYSCRHWEQLSNELNMQIKPKGALTFANCLEMGLQNHTEAIAKVAEVAAKEFSIEQVKRADVWVVMVTITVMHAVLGVMNGTGILLIVMVMVELVVVLELVVVMVELVVVMVELVVVIVMVGDVVGDGRVVGRWS